MSVIIQAIEKIENILNGIEGIIRTEANENRNFMADLNRDQLLRGEKSDGSEMPNYVKDSKQPQAPGKIVLFETGDFHQGIKPILNEKKYLFDGDDDKTDLMIHNYGAKIFGLTDESKKELREKLTPGVKERIRKIL